MAGNHPYQVTVHPHESPVSGACAYELGNTAAKNAVVFIGGLGDGPHTLQYVRIVAEHIEEAGNGLDYSVFEIRMRSSFIGFGTSSLKNDVEDISALVRYLRGIGREKIILFGHSTGCQDCMEYSNYALHGNYPVDGFILQAPVSDREALADLYPGLPASIEFAEKWIAEGRAEDCVPKQLILPLLPSPQVPMSAYRVHALGAKGGDDDYFSSDLSDEVKASIWGRFDKPVLVLNSENDEYVPKYVDQAALNQKYRDLNPMVSQLSGIIPDTGHQVFEEAAREWLGNKVAEFLRTL